MEQGGYKCPGCGYVNNGYTFNGVCESCGCGGALTATGVAEAKCDLYGIHCSLHSTGTKLSLELSRNGKVLKLYTFEKYATDDTFYEINDLGSGQTSSGVVCLSLAIEEEAVDCEPHCIQYAVEIDVDDTVHVRRCTAWSSSESTPYFMYDEGAKELVLIPRLGVCKV